MYKFLGLVLSLFLSLPLLADSSYPGGGNNGGGRSNVYGYSSNANFLVGYLNSDCRRSDLVILNRSQILIIESFDRGVTRFRTSDRNDYYFCEDFSSYLSRFNRH